MSTYGEVSWNDEYSGSANKKNNKDIWLRLDKGPNLIRLVTQPHQYYVHKVKKDGEKGWGQKVYCSKVDDASCPLCDQGYKAQRRWLLGVIDKKTSSFRLLDISWQVFSAIKKLAQNADVWGDPTKYDLNIIVDPNGGPSGYYSVQPNPHKPLSAAEQKIADEADLDELKRKVTPPSAEFVQKRIDKILAGGGRLEAPAAAAPAKGKTPEVDTSGSDDVDTSSGDESDDLFPNYDA